MILFITCDRTLDAPVESVQKFDDEESMLSYLGFDKDGCATEDEDDSVYGFDEDEITELRKNKVVYRDKREVYQIVAI